MKKYLFFIFLLAAIQTSFAKKVKFAVNVTPLYDMADSVHAAGIHIYGNFQGAAGYPFDWDPGSTPLVRETVDTMVYSIVVDIPAFYIYEYRFLNGDQSYEVEYVPDETRVNGAFDDNRWLFVDSLANDTTFIGILPYGGSAPDGLTLVRFRVNMSQQVVSSDGVHIAGSFQGWNPATTRMGVVVDASNIYEYQAYLATGVYQYKFANGTTAGDYEIVTGLCAVGGNREVDLTSHTMLDVVDFSSCSVGILENELEKNISLYPNPMSNSALIEFTDQSSNHSVSVADVTGRVVRSYPDFGNNSLRIDKGDLQSGIYFVTVKNNENLEATVKLAIQ